MQGRVASKPVASPCLQWNQPLAPLSPTLDPSIGTRLARQGPVLTPPPAILGRTQLEAVCHDFDQKLLPPD